MSIKELQQLLQLTEEELQHIIGTTGANINDIEYCMAQESWYRNIYPQEKVNVDMEQYKVRLKKEKHQLQKLMFVLKMKLIF